jgi:hypothetical protein
MNRVLAAPQGRLQPWGCSELWRSRRPMACGPAPTARPTAIRLIACWPPRRNWNSWCCSPSTPSSPPSPARPSGDGLPVFHGIALDPSDGPHGLPHRSLRRRSFAQQLTPRTAPPSRAHPSPGLHAQPQRQLAQLIGTSDDDHLLIGRLTTGPSPWLLAPWRTASIDS